MNSSKGTALGGDPMGQRPLVGSGATPRRQPQTRDGPGWPGAIAANSGMDQSRTAAIMEIRLASLLTGATNARGVVGIIDVFRAFSTAAVALANGAARIIMVGTVEEALALRNNGIGQVCMGRSGGDARRASTSPTPRSPFRLWIFAARPSSSAPAPAPRGSPRRVRRSVCMPPPSSRRRPRRVPCAPASRTGSPSWRWARTRAIAPTRTSYAVCTCATCWKAGREMATPCGG